MVAAVLTLVFVLVVLLALALWAFHETPDINVISILVAVMLTAAAISATVTVEVVYKAPVQIQFVPILTPVKLPAGKAEAC